MSTPKIIKNRRRRALKPNDPKKECLIKELSLVAQSFGFSVRREQLKQGIGWKVVSGTCRKDDQKIIFVDRKLSQSDQISFLMGKIVNLGLKPQEDFLQTLSEETRQFLLPALSV